MWKGNLSHLMNEVVGKPVQQGIKSGLVIDVSSINSRSDSSKPLGGHVKM